jgi:probable rRNA maturation factor
MRKPAVPRKVASAPRGRREQPHLVVAVSWHLRASWRAQALLRRVAEFVAAAEGFRTGRLSVAIVGAWSMAALHKQFLHRTGPTDVLAFDLGCDRQHGHLDGEVILCADVARREAARRAGRTLAAARAELALYLVHGLLHLAGHDDRTPRDFQRMHAREDELLRQLGLGPVFYGNRA